MKRITLICISCLLCIMLDACGNLNGIENNTTPIPQSNEQPSTEITENKSVTSNPQHVDNEAENKSATSNPQHVDNQAENKSATSNSQHVDNGAENKSATSNPQHVDNGAKSESKQSKRKNLKSHSSSVIDSDSYVGEYNDYDVDEPNLEIKKNDDGTYKIQIGIFRLMLLDKCVGHATAEGLEFTTKDMADRDLSGSITFDDDIATVKFISSNWKEYSSINKYKYYKTSDTPNIHEYK